MKSIFCPHCGKLLEQGEIYEFMPAILVYKTMLDYGNEFDREFEESTWLDDADPYYECGFCNEKLEDYTLDDVTNIYRRIESFEELAKPGVEFTTYDEELADEFNKYLKYIDDENNNEK